MADFIIVVILVLAVGGAGLYVYKAKKRGQTCIGCPHAKTCGRAGCGCHQDKQSDMER